MERIEVSRTKWAGVIAVAAAVLLAVPAVAQPPFDNYVDYGDWINSLPKGGEIPEGRDDEHVGELPTLQGGLTFFTDQGAFEAAAPGLPVEDFEAGNVPPAGVTVCDDPFDTNTSDACWSPGDLLAGFAFGSSSGTGMVIIGAGLIGNPSIAAGPNAFADSGDLFFTDGNTTAVGMDLLINVPGTVQNISVFGAGDVLLGTTTANPTAVGAFFGVISDEPITRINIDSANGDLVDNLQFGSGEPTLVVSDIIDMDLCVDPESNQNGIYEPGEGIQFSVELSALGGDFSGISGTVSSTTAGVMIVSGDSTWPGIANGGSALNDTPFVIELVDIPCFSTFDVVLDVTSDQGDFQFVDVGQVGQDLAPDVPLDIPDGDPLGIESDLVVATDVAISDLNVRVEITHTWVGDLFISLRRSNPPLPEVVLLDRPGVPDSTFGCSDDNMNVTFDDEGAMTNLEDHCAGTDPWFEGDATAVGSLSDFDGESTAGTWSLFVSDNAGADTGTIVDWELITDPAVGGACNTCNDSGLAPEPEVPVTEIPTLAPFGLLLLVGGLSSAAFFLLRRRR